MASLEEDYEGMGRESVAAYRKWVNGKKLTPKEVGDAYYGWLCKLENFLKERCGWDLDYFEQLPDEYPWAEDFLLRVDPDTCAQNMIEHKVVSERYRKKEVIF